MEDGNNALTVALKAEAARLGFVACGIALADAAPTAGARLQAWLASGCHGEMLWMADTAERRGSPRGLWPQVRSVICLGMSYAPADDPLRLEQEGGLGRISVYAQGQDYHDVVKKRLKTLARWLIEAARGVAPDAEVKVFVDTAPVMEKPLAEAAGIGWQGKHSNLVSREHGSWLFLGAIYTTLDLVPDVPHPQSCGSCTACQTACPTDAFIGAFRVDARRCISYLTIEHKGPIPLEFRAQLGNRIYGCDDCLAVCPWNKFGDPASREPAFTPRAELGVIELADLLALDDAGFREVFRGSPIKRIGRDRMVRNALIAAGNSGMPALLPAVRHLLDDPCPEVRGSAIWALSRLDEALWTAERAIRLDGEEDAAVRAEWPAGAILA